MEKTPTQEEPAAAIKLTPEKFLHQHQISIEADDHRDPVDIIRHMASVGIVPMNHPYTDADRRSSGRQW